MHAVHPASMAQPDTSRPESASSRCRNPKQPATTIRWKYVSIGIRAPIGYEQPMIAICRGPVLRRWAWWTAPSWKSWFPTTSAVARRFPFPRANVLTIPYRISFGTPVTPPAMKRPRYAQPSRPSSTILAREVCPAITEIPSFALPHQVGPVFTNVSEAFGPT